MAAPWVRTPPACSLEFNARYQHAGGVRTQVWPSFMTERRFTSFAEFWPHYLSEHSKPVTRVLHYLGTLIAIGLLIALIATGRWWLFPLAFLPGYAFAWVGHFFFEKNRPATFTYPLWSFMGDWKMLALMLTGRLK